MTILPFEGPNSIVKTRLPSHFARSGHIYPLPRFSHGCVRSLTNAQESFKLVLIVPIFHTFSVNSQNTFLLADFCM